MNVAPIFFAEPDSPATALRAPPRLASWNKAGDPDQVRLTEALDDAEALIAPTIRATRGALAIRLDVGLDSEVALLNEHDLDNYLYPLIRRLDGVAESRIASAWASKRHGAFSYLRCEPASPLVQPADPPLLLRTTAAASTTAFKQQISDQLADAAELPPGPVRLELAMVVGPARQWLNLWKPTIDALDRLLGRTRPDRAWHPLDGRITELGLHRAVDPTLGHDVVFAVQAGPAT